MLICTCSFVLVSPGRVWWQPPAYSPPVFVAPWPSHNHYRHLSSHFLSVWPHLLWGQRSPGLLRRKGLWMRQRKRRKVGLLVGLWSKTPLPFPLLCHQQRWAAQKVPPHRPDLELLTGALGRRRQRTSLLQLEARETPGSPPTESLQAGGLRSSLWTRGSSWLWGGSCGSLAGLSRSRVRTEENKRSVCMWSDTDITVDTSESGWCRDEAGRCIFAVIISETGHFILTLSVVAWAKCIENK